MTPFELPEDEKRMSFSQIYISLYISLHKEPVVWSKNIHWYIYSPEKVELHKDVFCVIEIICHDCNWIFKGLELQAMHPLTFYNYVVDRRGLQIFIWLTTAENGLSDDTQMSHFHLS